MDNRNEVGLRTESQDGDRLSQPGEGGPQHAACPAEFVAWAARIIRCRRGAGGEDSSTSARISIIHHPSDELVTDQSR